MKKFVAVITWHAWYGNQLSVYRVQEATAAKAERKSAIFAANVLSLTVFRVQIEDITDEKANAVCAQWGKLFRAIDDSATRNKQNLAMYHSITPFWRAVFAVNSPLFREII